MLKVREGRPSVYLGKSCCNLYDSRTVDISRRRSIKATYQFLNSRFLQRSQKQSGGNQLIHRHLTKTKAFGLYIGSQAGRQAVRRLWWMVFGVETRREVWGRG